MLRRNTQSQVQDQRKNQQNSNNSNENFQIVTVTLKVYQKGLVYEVNKVYCGSFNIEYYKFKTNALLVETLVVDMILQADELVCN